MRFFKRRSPEPPELVRLWRLPAEVGALHAGDPQLAMLAPPLHRAAVSGSPTATLVRRLQQRRECELAKEAMALSSEARGAGGPVGVVSPSSVPLCCFVEATGAARTATPPGSAKLKRGFAFSRVGRKPCVGPHKYSLPPTPMSLDRSSPCLVEWPQRLATFTQPLRLALPDLLTSREASRSVECLQERDDGGFFSECPERVADDPQRSSHQRSGGGVLRKTASRMYRSRSTSALVIEASLQDVDVMMDQDDLDAGAVMTVGRAAGRYRRDCFDDAVVVDAVPGCKGVPCSEDGSTASTASTASSGSGRVAPPSPPLEEEVGVPGASDTASLASSTQHRSDESGYESDGTKNGAEDSPNEDGPVTAAAGANFKQHLQRVDPKANGGMPTPRITSTEPMSLPFIGDAPPTAAQMPVPTATPPTPSKLSQRRTSTQEGSNVQRLAAALLQRISLQSPSGGSKGSDCCKQDKTRSECSRPHHQGASYDCKSLRCKTQSLFSVLRRGDSPQHSIAPTSPDAESSPRSERSASVQNSGSKLEQFRAWTLDRKLLRNRWKKSPSNSAEGGRGIGCAFGSPVLSRACSQEQSLRDEGGGTPLSQPMLKSAASWTNVCAGNDGVKENGGREGRMGRASVGELGLGCRNIRDVCGSTDLGPRASSTTDLRRRMWLEAHLEGGAGRQLQQQQQRRLSEVASVRSVPDGARVLAVRLAKDSRGELGVYIKGKCGPDGAVLGYVVADLEQDGPAARSGQLRKGDELLVINGHQVQGVEIEEARQLLATPDQVVHLLVARQEDVEEDCSDDTLTASPSPSSSRLSEPLRVPAERRASISHPGAAANYNTIPEVSEDGEKDNQATQQYSSGVLCTLPRRPRHHTGSSSSGGRSHGSGNSELLTVTFVKGPGRGALGFSVVGGRDSPRGALGIYVRRLFPGGQAEGLLREGDQLVSLNGEPFEGLSHAEAIAAFKRVRQGELVLRVARRPPKSSQVSKSCCNLDSMT